MTSKVIINLNIRTISKTSLLRNRFTPTWGARAACRALAERCSAHDIKIGPKDDLFGPYTKGLDAAGVTELMIEKRTPAKEIRRVLNTLTGRGFGATARILPKHIFTLEGISPDLNWDSLRKGLVGADYGADYPIDIGWALRPFQYLYRVLRFRSDCKLLDHLARGGQTSDLKRLANITNRLDYRDFKEFHQNWDFEMLAWLGERNYYFTRDNRRVNNSIRIARFSCDSGLLTALAANPIPAIRAAAAENPDTPEPVLGRLINEDPDKSVREAVRKNPQVVALLSLAANSAAPEELDELARKPFPCVREKVALNLLTPPKTLKNLAENDPRRMVRLAAAKNPNTPWESMALVLGQTKKEPVKGVVDTRIEGHWVSCDTIEYESVNIIGIIRYEYPSSTLEILREILRQHLPDRRLIMEKLKEINPELYDALSK